MTDVAAALLELSQQLLVSIDQQDWATYSDLCDPSLTAFEPEAVGSLVAGLEFHKFYFEMESANRRQQSTISSPDIRILDDSAIITYIRLIQRVTEEGRATTSACEETRIWQRQDGEWKHVHFHRSNAGNVTL